MSPQLVGACCPSCVEDGSSYPLLCLLPQPGPSVPVAEEGGLGPSSCLESEAGACG